MMPAGVVATAAVAVAVAQTTTAPFELRNGLSVSPACTQLCDTAYDVGKIAYDASKGSKTPDLCGADSKFQNAYISCSRCIEKRSPGAWPSNLLTFLALCEIDVELATSSQRLGDGSTTTIVNVKYAPTAAATVTGSADTDFDVVDSSSNNEPQSKAWIAGPVFGGLAGLGIIIGLVYFCMRRRKRNEEEEMVVVDDNVSEGGVSHKTRSDMRSEAGRTVRSARTGRSGRSGAPLSPGLSARALSARAKSDTMSEVDAMSQHPPSTKHYSVKSYPESAASGPRRFSEIDSVHVHEMVGSPVLRSVAESVVSGSHMDPEVSTIHTRYSEIDSRNISEMLGSPGPSYYKDLPPPPPLPSKDGFTIGGHSEIDSNHIHEMAGSPGVRHVYEKPANEVPAAEMGHADVSPQTQSPDDELDEMPVARPARTRDKT